MAAGDGLIAMTPTSVVVAGAGSSATINADGGVDFTSATSLSLNGVFTSGYDNYLIVVSGTLTSGDVNINARLRAAGSDASGTNYTRQYLVADGSATPSGARSTSQTSAPIGLISSTNRSGSQAHVYGPFLAQPTAWRHVSVMGYLSAYLQDDAVTHSLSTSYDGITLIPASSSMTGNVAVFGYEE